MPTTVPPLESWPVVKRGRHVGVLGISVLFDSPAVHPVSAGNCVTLCDLRVVVDQAAEPVPAPNAHAGQSGRPMRTPGGRVLLQSPVWGMRLVAVDVLVENQPQVPFAGDRHPVQAVAGAAHPAFRGRVRAAPGQGF
jgi:hypothetical protein